MQSQSKLKLSEIFTKPNKNPLLAQDSESNDEKSVSVLSLAGKIKLRVNQGITSAQTNYDVKKGKK